MRELARLLSVLLSIYNMLITLYIIMSWIRPMRAQWGGGGFSDTLRKIVDPYLNFFRGLSFLQRGNLDFTPLAALMVIGIVQRLLNTYAYTGFISFGYVLATIVQSLWWSVGSLIFGMFAVLVGIRLFFSYRRTQNSIQYISVLDTWLRRPLDAIHRYVFRGREVSDRVLLWTTLVLTIVAYILASMLVNSLIRSLVALPF